MCTLRLVEFGSSDKFEIYLFLQNVRRRMNDKIILDDCRHVLLLNSASNVNLALH